MVHLTLEDSEPNRANAKINRINRLPLVAGVMIALVFAGIVFFGLSMRGLSWTKDRTGEKASGSPATSFAERLKQGVSDGIIGDPDERLNFAPTPAAVARNRDVPKNAPVLVEPQGRITEKAPDDSWRARLKQEEQEQYMREFQRQRMARLQAHSAALDAPLQVDVSQRPMGETSADGRREIGPSRAFGSDRLAAAIEAAGGDRLDANGQAAKDEFLNHDVADLGYLPNQVVPQLSRFELKRGSVIPATMMSGLNSDLPGRIIAQVSQAVFDSATGGHLLIPQGARLFGRYDSKVSFGQSRALVVWTDIIFPDGATLQLGGMAGTDAEGYGGFSDKTDRHLWRTFGSAALVAVIGAGIDMSMPDTSISSDRNSASDAARRSFSETFGRTVEQTISKNLNVQPTIRIRPGYRFNILVDQDIIFPREFRNN